MTVKFRGLNSLIRWLRLRTREWLQKLQPRTRRRIVLWGLLLLLAYAGTLLRKMPQMEIQHLEIPDFNFKQQL